MKIPLYLAPMAGITDKPFRQMVRKFGNQTLFTEMVGVETLLRGFKTTQKMIDLTGEKNIIVQLVGVDAGKMAEAAKIVEQTGAIGIDINMGCPVKKLISNYSGAKLMLEPERAEKIAQTVVKSVSVPVSVKMRLGWDEARKNAIPFSKMLEECG
ncbi:MAG: tRNA-dihydrouridine synthase family protein, partial [Alphaproteobacteria bacterium]|nr:tRNA-dihydrouridine synthase family protein [Alphaproteobacteria bacterium]